MHKGDINPHLDGFGKKIMKHGASSIVPKFELVTFKNGLKQSINKHSEIFPRFKDVVRGHICIHAGFTPPSEITSIEDIFKTTNFTTGFLTGITNKVDAKRTSPYNVKLGTHTVKVVEGHDGRKASDSIMLPNILIVDEPEKEKAFVRKEQLLEAYRTVIREYTIELMKRTFGATWKKFSSGIDAWADVKFEAVKSLVKSALVKAEHDGHTRLVDFQREFNSIIKVLYGGGEIHEHETNATALNAFVSAEKEITNAAKGDGFVPFLFSGRDGKGIPLKRKGDTYYGEGNIIVPIGELQTFLDTHTIYPSGLTHVFIHHGDVLARQQQDSVLAVVVGDEKHKNYVLNNISIVNEVFGMNSQVLLVEREGSDLFTQFFNDAVRD